MQAPVDISESELFCPECEYNLAGCTSDRCPWCGWNIEVQELVASNFSRKSGARLTVSGAAFLIGLFCAIGLLGLLSQVDRQGRRLDWHDALAVVSVFAVCVAHFTLAVASLRSHHRWPMARGEISNVLRLIGWGSIAASVVAATPQLSNAPNPLVVRGIHVNGVLEFAMTSAFFAMPGVMLLILTLVSYRGVRKKAHVALSARHTSAGAPFLVEMSQKYSRDQIVAVPAGQPRRSSPEIESVIARTWETENAISQEDARPLFNGRIARLARAEAGQNRLILHLGETSYRDFLGTNLFHAREVTAIDPGARADALGTSALVMTTDGFIALGRRSRKVAFHAEHLHTLGGLVEEADRTSDGYEIAGSLRRELTEELGLRPTELSEVVVTGLVRDRAILQPELLFDVSCLLSRAELRNRFKHTDEIEHAMLEFVADTRDHIPLFLVETKAMTPVAQAALLLHGMHAWGRLWYEQTCMALYGGLPEKVGPTASVSEGRR